MTSDIQPLHEQLCFTLYAASHAMTRVYKPLLEPLGLTYTQYIALLALWDQDGLSVKALGERLTLDSGTLTPLIKRLEAADLVMRSRDPDDERLVRVYLTPQGKALRERARSVQDGAFCATGMDMGAIADLRAQLAKLQEKLVTSAASPG